MRIFIGLALLLVFAALQSADGAETPNAKPAERAASEKNSATDEDDAPKKSSKRLPPAVKIGGGKKLAYKPGNAAVKAAGKGSQTMAATRGPNKNDLRLVALAPESDGVTLLAAPRIWWWQSQGTEAGELEFSLTKVSGRPRTVFSIKLGAQKEGFNAIDLADELINPEQVVLEPGVTYAWSLGCHVPPAKPREPFTKMSIKAYLVSDRDDKLNELLSAEAIDADGLAKLAESGNWYELFDLVSFASVLQPEDKELAAVRNSLLKQVDVDGEIGK